MQRTFFLAVLAASTLGFAHADELSGPGRRTLVNESWGTIFCRDKAKVSGDVMGTRYRIETERGTIALARTGNSWVLQAPNQNLIVRKLMDVTGNDRLSVQFNTSRFMFEHVGKDYIWNFGGRRVFFNLREGEVRGALGDEGAFKLHKRTGGIAYNVESEQGETEVTVGRKKRKGGYTYKVVRQSGQDLKLHPYLVRGVVFDNGPVGVFVKMPKNPLLEALDWSQVRTVSSSIPYPGQTQEATETTTSTPTNSGVLIDPQQVDPLQAPQARPDEDPLRLKRKPFEKDKSMFDVQKPLPEADSQWTQPPR